MANKCSACGRFANTAEGAKCGGKCGGFFHKICVNIPKDAKVAQAWLCPGCKAQTPRKDNTDNPVRGESADYEPVKENPVESTSVSMEILNEVRVMRGEMNTFRHDFSALREQLCALRDVVEGFGRRMDNLETRLGCLEQKCQETPASPDVSNFLETIERLKSEVNDREQESLQNDLEITGIPEEQSENPGHLVVTLAEKLGITCAERDIVCAERVGVRRAPSSGESASDLRPRPRPLVLRLARTQVRDSFLQAARVRRGITTEGMGLAAAVPTRLYVNERLSKYNKMLFFKTREEARSHGWKYVWTRRGRIFIRRETGKASFCIRSEKDFEKIFGAS